MARQRREIRDVSGLAIAWLYEKRDDVADILGVFDPFDCPDDRRRRALERIYANAARDRIIAAIAGGAMIVIGFRHLSRK